MGFYGNITDTSKTTFSFDLIYPFRKDMDNKANEDGVFLGRYVLVDYDEPPIKAYAKKNNDGTIEGFYNTANFASGSKLVGKTDYIYEDLHEKDSTNFSKFYKYFQGAFTPLQAGESTYHKYFETDVNEYGRGFDSTVWVKRYDTKTNKYKYAMIAELNAVVPTLHMIVSEPNTVPTTPYFDRDTTNIDYYLHMQSDYGTRLKPLPQQTVDGQTMRSDENFVYKSSNWVVDKNGYSGQVPVNIASKADIYYNNAGFDPTTHNYSEGSVEYFLTDNSGNRIEDSDNITGFKTATVNYSENHIGYDMGRSGRLYGADADLGVYKEGTPADDIYDWFIRLPGIGNSICRIWDKIYGYRNDNKRYLNSSLTYEDSENNLVTYDKNTVIGIMNTARDLIGYHFISLDEYSPKEIVETPTDTITVNLTYGNGINSSQEATYNILDCIFYRTNDSGEKTYYAYRYDPVYGNPVEPEFTDDTHTAFKDNKVYYYKDSDSIYHVANPKAYKATNANGEIIAATSEYYLATPKWTIASLDTITDNNFYSLIAQIHKLLGTNINDTRDMNSIQGSINAIKDVIKNINTNLMPGRMLHTNNQGIIETFDNTYFPSAKWDEDEVLSGAGEWVSRFAKVTVLSNSNNDNQKADEVNTISNGIESKAEVIIESDNDKSNNGVSLVNYKKHSANNLTLGSRNKWIELYGNADKDSIEFKHSQSPIVSRLRAEQAEGSSYVDMFKGVDENENVILKDSTSFQNFSVNDNATEIKVEPTTDNLSYEKNDEDKNDNRLTIPYVTVDNAGHVVELGTKNFNIPNNFKKIATTTIDDDNESASLDQAGISIAETINDTLNLAPRNRWIDIATETTNDEDGKQEDTITWSHRLVPTQHLKTDVTLNGERRTEESEIPTVYRYGLPQDKSITDLDKDFGNEDANTFNVPYIEIDKAGHIVAAETHTVELPESYTTIQIGNPINDDLTSDTLAAAATVTADTLTESLIINPSNKWIRLKGENTEGVDTITIGHEIHTIDTSSSNTTDLDVTSNKNIITKFINWDQAGHVISEHTETWKLPYSLRNIDVTTAKALNSIENNSEATKIETTQISDTFNFKPANNWIRLQANGHEISFGHLIQGTAAIYTGTDTTFVPPGDTLPRFGDSVTLYGYETDAAGHVIGYPTYTLTLPKGSCTEDENNNANVLTSLSFNSITGALHGNKTNIGDLLLTGYTKLDVTATAAIQPTNTINAAFSILDNRIENEEEARATAIGNLRMFNAIEVAGVRLEADSNADTLTITAGNDGIVLTPTNTNDSFTIKHKAGYQVENGFYKLSTDVYGHVFTTSEVELSDLTSLGVATAIDLNAHVNTVAGNPHKVTATEVGLGNVTNESKTTMFASAALTGNPTAPTQATGDSSTKIATTAFVNTAIANQWISNYSSFDALYNAIVQKLTTDGYIEATGA